MTTWSSRDRSHVPRIPAGATTLEVAAGAGGGIPVALDDVLDDLSQVGLFQLELEPPRRDPGHVQELLGQPGQALELRRRPVEELAGLLLLPGLDPAAEGVKLELHRGQRRAQLVTCHREEFFTHPRSLLRFP